MLTKRSENVTLTLTTGRVDIFGVVEKTRRGTVGWKQVFAAFSTSRTQHLMIILLVTHFMRILLLFLIYLLKFIVIDFRICGRFLRQTFSCSRSLAIANYSSSPFKRIILQLLNKWLTHTRNVAGSRNCPKHTLGVTRVRLLLASISTSGHHLCR